MGCGLPRRYGGRVSIRQRKPSLNSLTNVLPTGRSSAGILPACLLRQNGVLDIRVQPARRRRYLVGRLQTMRKESIFRNRRAHTGTFGRDV